MTYVDVFLEAELGLRAKSEQYVSTAKRNAGRTTYEGKIVPLAPLSGMSLFFRVCVAANP